MNSPFCTYSIEQQEFRIDYPDKFSPKESILERERDLNLTDIKGHVVETVFNGICIERRNVNLERPMDVLVQHDFPFLKMHFEIDGHSTYVPFNNQSLDVDIPGGRHQLFFFPKVDGQLHYKAYKHRNTLEITLSLEFIQRVFKDQWQLLLILGNAIKNNQPIVVGERSHLIDNEIHSILSNIINCPIEGPLKQYYLEAKVIELLIMQIQSLVNTSDKVAVVVNEHYQKMQQLSTYLQDNLGRNVTIDELSKKIGMNTSKLKKEFKMTFGETIFNHHNRLKMEYALRALKTSTKSITSIATDTGYNYVQHFSKAFKKYHGMLPSDLR